MRLVLRYKIDGCVVESDSLENSLYKIDVYSDGTRTKLVMNTKKPVKLAGAFLTRPYAYEGDDLIFVNGYQSWTDTREYTMDEKLKSLKAIPEVVKDKYHFAEYGDSWFLKYDKNRLHGYTYSYVKKQDGTARLWGSLNEENAYLIIHHEKDKGRLVLQSDIQGRVVDGEFVLFDFVEYTGLIKDVQKKYFENYGRCDAKPLRGYTSWYNDYQDINEEKMLNALEGIDGMDYDLFQIDDGWESHVGDWLEVDEKKFPDGLIPIVNMAHGRGLKAGIWVAPFVAEMDSSIYLEHPDWILRKGGKEVFAGSNWSGAVALDVRKKAVWDHIEKSLKSLLEQGFDFFKLDFLYAAALAAPSGSFTRAEIMRKSMKRLKNILGDKLILGCGVPLSSAFNLVDYCRIGPDITLNLDDKRYMRLAHRERVSTKVTLMNTIYRYAMDGYVFRNDPDVYLLRDDNIKLDEEQREAIITIDHLCGAMYLTSDNVNEYDERKRDMLAAAQMLCGAEITDIEREGEKIKIDYVLEGRQESMVYNSDKAIIERRIISRTFD